MGNTSSSESPRKAQKLSKLRLGDRLSAADLLNPSDLTASSSTRYCDSYLAASHPALVQCPSPMQEAPVEYEDAAANSSAADLRLSMRESGVQSANIAVPSSLEPQARGRQRSSRANSMVRHGGGGVQSPSWNHSLHGNGYREHRGRTPSENRPSGHRQPSKDPNCLQTTQPTATETKSETSQSTGAPSRSPRPPETVSSPIARNNSDVPLCIPMRRRSLIQTPGVATRRVKDDRRSPTLPSTQVKPATPAIQPSYDSPPHQIDGRLSPPPYALVSEPQDRAVTPCEADYRQLGGMKFGTLRITNGSPVPSSAVEIGERQSDSSGAERVAHDGPAWPTTKEGVILSDKSYPDDTVKSVQPLSNSSIPVLSSVAAEFTSDQNIELEIESSWLLGPNEEYTVTATPTTSDCQSSPESGESKREQDMLDMEYLSPEILTVREDPSAKFRGNTNGPRPSGKPLGSSMARSDSGLVSTSTSSSTSSRVTLCQPDSGYSSNFSLRSIRTSSKKKRHDAEEAARFTEPAPESRNSLPPSLGNGTRPGKGRQSASSSRISFAFMSRDRMRRLSTQADKHHKLPSPESGVLSKNSRSRCADVEASERLNNSAMRKQGKLRRLLGSTKRQNFPTAYMPHDIHDTIPAVPSDVEEKLREHNGLFPTASKRIALRVEPSQETLRTIMSVDSLDLADIRTQHVGSFPEARSERTSPHTPAQEQVGSRPRMLDLGGEEYGFISRDAGPCNRADATGLHVSTSVDGDEARSSPRVWRTLTKPSQLPPAYSSETHALESRVSAPDLTDSPTISPYPTLSQPSLHSSKSPPPISLRTRDLKSSRRQSSSLSSSTAFKAVPSLSQKSSREQCHPSHPLQVATQDLSRAGKPPQVRQSYGGPSRHPPVVFRQPHFRDRSTGTRTRSDVRGQQYRIFHSHNLPAYKNVPIWG
ncbi:Uncharacterized protein TCAP_04986 [Tolypocladium capitatum]|uniref:Uncharacterized protein n=1 Tax=Tolypocladium capitatum TaxID=45235 RepID=A0A2K3QC03_9HYPO|nr:Uncharacterized protein TCAP_04986 [Tolypocladium capitatum]